MIMKGQAGVGRVVGFIPDGHTGLCVKADHG